YEICDNLEYGPLTRCISTCRETRSPLSCISSATSTSEVLSDTEEKVPLGDGVFCFKTAYNALVNVEDSHADWAYALLKGVFGEKAHLMRVRINKKHTENERFPSNFLMVANPTP
ncbi:uncharacterized protein LOC109504293, partial [Harpegnathos saltator]|uniref:uncharacterized protein LOC109504293 n=1 Tax=Harpegnathos saltator TaxID=610380 RepID=UPI000DBED660